MQSAQMQETTNTTYKYLPWLAAMAIFMQSLDGTILITSLPSIAKDMNYSPLEMQSIIVSYTLTLAIFIPLSGWLSDKFGTKKIFSLAVAIFTLGSLFCALSPDLTTLIISRIIQAIGGSMMVPVARLAILYAYPKNQLLKVINFMTIPGLIGPVIGPSLGGFLSDNYSWHWIFLVNLPIGIIGLIFTQKIMPNFTNKVGKFDLVGLLYFSLALVVFTLLLELSSVGISSLTLILTLLGLSILFFILYIKHSKKTKDPIIDLKLFRIRTLRIGLSGSLFTRLGISGIPFLLPLMLQVGFGYSATIAGLMLLPSALSNVIIKPFVVPLVQKIGYRNILISNTLILAIIIFTFSFATKETPLFYFIILMVIYGAVNSIQMASMNTISLSDLDNNTASSGNSLLAIMQQLSMSFGISAAALALSFFKNYSGFIEGDTVTAFKYSFITLGILTALSTVVFTKLKKNDGNLLSGK
ncbi:DHA2 family efflux MFS transporter permease subunit [Paenimyroides tangerinum]|uniref:DHA2 family efflux MFS transporter permease subunit n=1 Tax=Paenimyroides tangerinum TaxID=2488728 RepID=A0A3P3W7P3_9FLAO|nr:multidrug transporter subunit MdtD [Paenimyroides tangerinum]RRJ90980.1 DHA2 family efflux MFS transporter permease subunit [Paenimyroides tangerinum]